MPIVNNLPNLAKQVYDFYNSGYANTIINVIMSSPVNDIVQFHIVRQDTYQNTLNELISRIQLFLSMQIKVKINYSVFYLQCRDKNEYIKFRKKVEFDKYLIRENLTGKLNIA
jgi:hypothetical protein